MSYSNVSQGLQSCLEPKIIEKRVLMLKLAPPCSNHSPNSECCNCNNSTSTNTSSSFSSTIESYDENPISPNISNNEHDLKRANKDSSESWSFLQSLSNISHCNNKSEESVYVHPKVKCSSSMLSSKSLEMCTESLGCETGSESSDDMSLLSLESNNVTSFMRNNNNNNNSSKRLNGGNGRSFPPPLTSMSDLGGVQVRPHREDGRLILEAVTCSSPPSFELYFHAERSNGRLRLRLFESVESCCSDEEEEQEQEEGEEEEEESEIMKNEECDFDDDEEEEEEEEEENVGNAEGEMGITTKFTTPRRCKESGRKRDIFGDGYFELPSLSLYL